MHDMYIYIKVVRETTTNKTAWNFVELQT